MDVTATERVPRRGASLPLLALVVLLAVAVALGGVLAWHARQERADALAAQERYGDVLRSATATSLGRPRRRPTPS